MISGAEKLAQRYPLAKRMVEEGTAPEATQRAVELLLEGKVGREIGEALGVSRAYAYELLNDPTGEAAYERRHRHHGICEDCGAKTFSGGGLELPKRCNRCAPKAVRAETREYILQSIRDWNHRYGSPPGAMDWNVPSAITKAHPKTLALIRLRHSERAWPGSSTVVAAFGSWNAAIEAAGFSPMKPGERKDPKTWRKNMIDGKQTKKGQGPMASPTEVISREIDKNQERRKRFLEQIAQIDADTEQLEEAAKAIEAAKKARNGSH